MKLKFKQQQYQTDAVESVIRVFSGQSCDSLESYIVDKGRIYQKNDNRLVEISDLGLSSEIIGHKNKYIELNKDTLLENIRKVQSNNGIRLSSTLVDKLGDCQLDVEMETGTGKTYVYIKTMFELNRHYGWTKFIVVVPSIAIREGVKKSLDITQDHFMESYGKKIRYFVYNSDNLSPIDTYSQSCDISLMIINIQAFNSSMREGGKSKSSRVIYSVQDRFGSRRPIDVISANRPIVILDEPQKMGGGATQTALKSFNPLFTLNYSATHKESHNPVYVLDALDAYNQKLVKQIEVIGFDLSNLKGTDSYLYFQDIILSNNAAPKALIEIEVKYSKYIKRESRYIQVNDDLFHISGGLEQYRGYVLADINVDTLNGSNSAIHFVNGVILHLKTVLGNITEEHKARIQIRETIKSHLKKESYLFDRGIKTLSLFFLDEVANYRKYDDYGTPQLGRYGEIFEEEYLREINRIKGESDLHSSAYISYISSIQVNETHSGYFSIDKYGKSINSDMRRGTDLSDDISAYDLILKNKELLLSFDVPVRFIFSHSALREGWDNPNVFQICSLRQAGGVAQKRQEVGRGLRLCVDQFGIRMDSQILQEDIHKINRLTVIASEGYASFVSGLQEDIKSSLYDRPLKVNIDFFEGQLFPKDEGGKFCISKVDAQEIVLHLRVNDYITKDGEVTDVFRAALSTGQLKEFPEELSQFSDVIYKKIQSVYDKSILNYKIENGSSPQTPENKLNENFYRKEFQELWNRINHKYAYKVSFNSKELVDNAVLAINKELTVAELTYMVRKGRQKDKVERKDVVNSEMITSEGTHLERLDVGSITNVKYDLIGKLATETVLTRKTIASILSEITPEKFNLFRLNPEEFIIKASQLILEQKATMIVEHISYSLITGEYATSIFTQDKRTDIDKAFRAKKSVQDYVFVDGTAEKSIERRFVEDLECSKEVVVYAKLPKGFHIPTPVGNYSPDWAIAFEKEQVKHVYFVAETKGSMSSMELRQIERDKIACAEKLFDQLSTSDVKYGKIDSFESLMNLVK